MEKLSPVDDKKLKYKKTSSRARLRLQLRRGKMLVVHYIKHGGVLSPMILKIGAAIAY